MPRPRLTPGTPTVQEQMRATLEASGLPYKRVNVYGRQIVVTAWSRDAAIQWGSLLAKFARVLRVGLESKDYNQENEGSNLCPTTHPVWLTYARVE